MQHAKKCQKIAIWAPSHNFVGLYLLQLRHVSTIGNIRMSTQYGELHPTSGWDRFVSLGTPANFTGFRVFITAATSLNGWQPNFSQCLALTWAGRLYIHFRQLLLCNGILPGAKFTLRPPSLALSYWQRYCTVVEQWVLAKLCGVEHRAPPIFGGSTITLGIGPNSSFIFIFMHDAWFKQKSRFNIGFGYCNNGNCYSVIFSLYAVVSSWHPALLI